MYIYIYIPSYSYYKMVIYFIIFQHIFIFFPLRLDCSDKEEQSKVRCELDFDAECSSTQRNLKRVEYFHHRAVKCDPVCSPVRLLGCARGLPNVKEKVPLEVRMYSFATLMA